MNTQNSTEPVHKINGKHGHAIALLVEDKLTDEQIAEQVGVTRDGLAKWKTWPEFQAAYQVALAEFYIRVKNRRFAIKERRVALLNDLAERLMQVIEERAADARFTDEPGMATGTMLRTEKVIRRGRDSEIEYEFKVDTATLSELRAILKQVQEELGQQAKTAIDVTSAGEPISHEYDGVSTLELLTAYREILELKRG